MISFIVPVYNGEEYIGSNYESFKQQTNYDFQVIYVDDGSSDNTYSILENIALSDHRVIVIKSSNQGAMLARKLGLSQAKFDYVSFVDVDDTLAPNFNEIFQSHLGLADIIIGSYKIIKNNKSKDIIKPNIFISKDEYINTFFLNGGWELWGKVFSKSLFVNIIYKDGLHIGEDVIIFSQCIKNSRLIKMIPDIVYEYKINTSSISLVKDIALARQGLIACKFIVEELSFFKDENLSKSLVLLFFSNSSRRGLISRNDPLFKFIEKSFFVFCYKYIGYRKFFYIISLFLICYLRGK